MYNINDLFGGKSVAIVSQENGDGNLVLNIPQISIDELKSSALGIEISNLFGRRVAITYALSFALIKVSRIYGISLAEAAIRVLTPILSNGIDKCVGVCSSQAYGYLIVIKETFGDETVFFLSDELPEAKRAIDTELMNNGISYY